MKDPNSNQTVPPATTETVARKPIQRWSAARKRDIVLRLLRGESIEAGAEGFLNHPQPRRFDPDCMIVTFGINKFNLSAPRIIPSDVNGLPNDCADSRLIFFGQP
jgi:hypothetical protein